MAPQSDSGRAASYIVAAVCFWIAPVAVAALYYVLFTGFRPQPNRHAFEQGVWGLIFVTGFAGIVCTVNLVGFGASIIAFGKISAESSTAYYVVSGIAGIASLLGFVLVDFALKFARIGFVSTSNAFWNLYYAAIACIVSVTVSIAVFAIAIAMHVIDKQ